ncbi:hypothetical protein VSH64_28535 [Amycolatopsis rhabdoformis]|uniref:Uncharacterized protein n=1 Tax=Amycolatopsis rhabdoformis TaxID=1448059 RepID=A0ABZ1HZ24_9PSEU|nr:hypothetical protein [Amycolatopsis rhabdoformis]WSE26822.1 hypothetical protein VSH64_28535 [Amycolatopsis rhabdoformis]
MPSSSTSKPTPPPIPPNALAATLLVGFCGAPRAQALGKMTGDLAAAGRELVRQAGAYRQAVTPVVELIATAAHRTPGPDGLYRSRASDTTIAGYLAEARALKGVLLLNIQPGRADFLPEVRAYERWLAEPDVGVALDPEWAVEPGVVPGEKFGRTTGAELDSVAAYLAQLAADRRLPEKIMAYHQVAASIVRDEDALKAHPGVSIVKVVDGIGSAGAKKATWRTLMAAKPAHVLAGFKLFYEEDTRHGAALMTPSEVLALTPKPAYVVYE